MINKKEIHKFAVKWNNKYKNSNTPLCEVENSQFAEECFAFGFEMDCGKEFEAAFPETNAFNNYRNLERVIGNVSDIGLIGSAIISKWRYITHWSREDLLSEENRLWFVTAFSRLAVLTSDDELENN